MKYGKEKKKIIPRIYNKIVKCLFKIKFYFDFEISWLR